MKDTCHGLENMKPKPKKEEKGRFGKRKDAREKEKDNHRREEGK